MSNSLIIVKVIPGDINFGMGYLRYLTDLFLSNSGLTRGDTCRWSEMNNKEYPLGSDGHSTTVGGWTVLIKTQWERKRVTVYYTLCNMAS
jgi:hypothetical protein